MVACLLSVEWERGTAALALVEVRKAGLLPPSVQEYSTAQGVLFNYQVLNNRKISENQWVI